MQKPNPNTSAEAPFSLQESALAHDMRADSVGSAVTGFVMEDGVNRRHQHTHMMDSETFDELVDQFRQDPKKTLGLGREDLYAIAGDTKIPKPIRERRVGRYLDAYLSLTLKLDRGAFPPTPDGQVSRGIPDYLPDGFVDMGGTARLDPASRSREKILLDKEAVFKKHRDTLLGLYLDEEILSADNGQRKKLITQALAKEVYFGMPYKDLDLAEQGITLNISDVDEGVCRHHAMVFQALNQAMGISSRLFKNNNSFYRDGQWSKPERHAANLVRVNGKWAIFDATQPDSETQNGQQIWRPGVIEIDVPPGTDEVRTYEGTLRHNGQRKRYTSNTDAYWYIKDTSE